MNMPYPEPSSPRRKEGNYSPDREDIDLLEGLIRKTYHDGANIFGPLRELISLKFESSLGDYIVNNFTYYISLLKNLRFVYLFHKSPSCFKTSHLSMEKLLERLLLEKREKYGEEERESSLSDLTITGPEEAIIVLFSNLLANAFRFGENICVRIEGSKVIIHNTVESCIPPTIESIYELPVTYDKFGILGAGVGLKIVKEITDYLGIEIDGEVGENHIRITTDLANLAE